MLSPLAVPIVHAHSMDIALNLGYRCIELDIWRVNADPSQVVSATAPATRTRVRTRLLRARGCARTRVGRLQPVLIAGPARADGQAVERSAAC